MWSRICGTDRVLPERLRLREHACSLRVATGSNLETHCRACNCSSHLEHTEVLKRFRDTRTRAIYQVWEIAQRGEDCVSTPLVALYKKELGYLNMRLE